MTLDPDAARRRFGLSDELFPFDSRFLQVAGARLHHIDEGSGPVVVLLHGNPAWCFVYRHVVRALRSRYRCIAIDLPGFGLSEPPPGYGYTPAEHAGVVSAAPFAPPRDRAPLHVFAHHILASRDWLAQLETELAGWRGEAAFVWPDNDVAFRRKELARWRRLWPHVAVTTIARCGHFLWEDAPLESVAALGAALDATARSAAADPPQRSPAGPY